MRYLVTAHVKPGCRAALRRAIDDGSLGAGSVAGDEYFRNMEQARELSGGRVKWVETCFCATPLQEERPYWEEFFELDSVKDAHARSRVPRRERHRAVVVHRLRLHEAPRRMAGQAGQAVRAV